jgi:putative ABC transport system ATP-binding protein
LFSSDAAPVAKTQTTSSAPAVIIPAAPTLVGTGLYRSFGQGDTQAYAIRDVSIELKKNELNLLMGPSGSGKTTLLAVLSALLHPTAGQVSALGEELWSKSQEELEQFRLKHCSYVFQGYNLFPALTAREQLEIVLRWGEGCSTREARQRSEKVLGQLGLGNKMHLRPIQMSGGEKQRVAIGRALVKNPSFLFADEPTSALDWSNGQQVIDLLHEVARERGATVLVVTHDPRLVPYADNVYEMADGQLQAEGEHTHDVVPLAPAPLTVNTPAAGHNPNFNGHTSHRTTVRGARLTLTDPTVKVG